MILRISISSFLLSLALCVAPTAKASSETCPIQSGTSVAVFGDVNNGGVYSYSLEWVQLFFTWWGVSGSVQVLQTADVQACTDLTTTNYPSLKLFVMPGGTAYKEQKALGATGKANILLFVNSGGGFWGACAGFFYASTGYYYDGTLESYPNLAGIFPKLIEGPINAIAKDPWYAMSPIKLANGSTINSLYYGGPTIGLQYTSATLPPGWTLNASFTVTNTPAVITSTAPKVVLNSPHLEAYENIGITGLTTTDRLANYQYLASLIQGVQPYFNAFPIPTTP